MISQFCYHTPVFILKMTCDYWITCGLGGLRRDMWYSILHCCDTYTSLFHQVKLVQKRIFQLPFMMSFLTQCTPCGRLRSCMNGQLFNVVTIWGLQILEILSIRVSVIPPQPLPSVWYGLWETGISYFNSWWRSLWFYHTDRLFLVLIPSKKLKLTLD